MTTQPSMGISWIPSPGRLTPVMIKRLNESSLIKGPIRNMSVSVNVDGIEKESKEFLLLLALLGPEKVYLMVSGITDRTMAEKIYELQENKLRKSWLNDGSITPDPANPGKFGIIYELCDLSRAYPPNAEDYMKQFLYLLYG
jgi:hypothetical protein